MPTFIDVDSGKTKPPAYCTQSGFQTEEMDPKLIKTDKSASTATMTTPTPFASPNTYQVPDRYAPQVFNGVYPDLEAWLAHIKRYITCRQLLEQDQLAFFPLFMQDKAIDWYDTLQPTQRDIMDDLLTEFTQFFCPLPLDHMLDTETVFT